MDLILRNALLDVVDGEVDIATLYGFKRGRMTFSRSPTILHKP